MPREFLPRHRCHGAFKGSTVQRGILSQYNASLVAEEMTTRPVKTFKQVKLILHIRPACFSYPFIDSLSFKFCKVCA